MSERLHVNVIGAGAFGGWAALELLRAGCSVTLLEAWSPGHSRASSGDETRVLRHAYAEREHYVPLVQRSLAAWRALEAAHQTRLFRHTGVLWLLRGEAAFEAQSRASFERAGLPFEVLDRPALAARYPALAVDDLDGALFEHEAGALSAQRACEVVHDAVRAAGGDVRVGAATGVLRRRKGGLTRVALADGSELEGDAHVFACGPWLPKLFQEVLEPRLIVTRQETFAFGVPPGDTVHNTLPVWAERGPTFWYGIPNGMRGGFKVGEDTWGGMYDPTVGDRTPSARGLARVRGYLARRFPALADAPLVDARVCQYTLTTDQELLLDRHPEHPAVWFAGGGSGHGFKLGPAVGALVAAAITEGAELDARFSLERGG
ncbi:MAG: FAD-dependent oxidoreductase [Planctomycetota bacterium]